MVMVKALACRLRRGYVNFLFLYLSRMNSSLRALHTMITSTLVSAAENEKEDREYEDCNSTYRTVLASPIRSDDRSKVGVN